MRIAWSYGGGVQTTAIAILIAQGKLPKPDIIVMADTNGERRKVWQYIMEYTLPLLDSIGLTIEIAPHSLSTVDFYGKNGNLLVPVFTETSKLSTYCSGEWKREVVRRYLVSRGFDRYVSWLGISVDELHRCKKSRIKAVTQRWPLCYGYGVTMNRVECYQLIANYGWPEPPTSACVWCPHWNDKAWQEMKDHEPEDFARAIAKDEEMRTNDKRGGVWLHKSHKPLALLQFDGGQAQTAFTCENGECGL